MVLYYCVGCEKVVEDDERCNCGKEWVATGAFFDSLIGFIVTLCKQEGILISILLLLTFSSLTLCCYLTCKGNKNTRVEIEQPIDDFLNGLSTSLLARNLRKVEEIRSREIQVKEEYKMTQTDQKCSQKQVNQQIQYQSYSQPVQVTQKTLN